MPVKLLSKSQLQALKEKERTVEIQEGVKLANRVDGLRSLYSKTQEDFEAYKIATLTELAKEIEELNNQKDNLSGLVRKLRSEYDTLLPEIPMKRDELSKFEDKLMAWERKLEKREEKAGLLEIDVMEAHEQAEDLRIRTEDNERITRNLLIQATKKRDEADNTLKTARQIQQLSYKEKNDAEKALALRELSIKAKEDSLSNKELALMNKENELNQETIKVADARETLKRSIERIRQGRHE